MDRRQFLGRVSALAGGILLPYFPGFARANYLYLPHRRKAFRSSLPAYTSNGSLLDLSCTAAELADGWTDADAINGVSQAVTNQPGADPVATAWEFDTNTFEAGCMAGRNKDVGSIEGLGTQIVLSFRVYLDAVGTFANADYLQITIRRSDWRLNLALTSDGIQVRDSVGEDEIGSGLTVQDSWQVWSFDIDLSGGVASGTADVYLDGVLAEAAIDANYEEASTDGYVGINIYGFATSDRIAYLDWFKIGDGFA